MVKLTSLLALSTLIIAPALASELWDLESREASTGLFARQQDFEHPDLFRRIVIDPQVVNAAMRIGKNALFGRDVQQDSAPAQSHFTAEDLRIHAPWAKHAEVPRDFNDELFERDLYHDFYIRDLTDEDLFERFYYDDLDY
jgi:hypothetical protein